MIGHAKTLTINLPNNVTKQPNLAPLMVLVAELVQRPMKRHYTVQLGLEGYTANVRAGKTIVVDIKEGEQTAV